MEVRLLSAACRQKGSRRELFVVLGEGYGHGVSTEERHPSLDDRFDPAVRIVDYDAAWPGLAEAELHRIEETLSGVAVRLEHVGSTAVPGLAAKPIVDLLLSVPAIEPRQRYVQPLQRLGYLFAPAPESPDLHSSPGRRSVRARITCTSARPEASTSFATSPSGTSCAPTTSEAARYEALKRRVAGRHPQDRLAYIEGKSAYVAALEERAVRWARERG